MGGLALVVTVGRLSCTWLMSRLSQLAPQHSGTTDHLLAHLPVSRHNQDGLRLLQRSSDLLYVPRNAFLLPE